MSTEVEPSIAWGGLLLATALACFFPGQARASSGSSPPAASRPVVLHLDSEVGDDAASGLTWDEPLRSLEEVQRRIEEGRVVVGLRLAAGWYPGTLRTDRPLRIEGGFPPAGLPREGARGLRGDPERHPTVLDGLGRGPVVTVEGCRLQLDGVILSGGWSLDGGAVALLGGSLAARAVELRDSGPALIGCLDCDAVDLEEVLLHRGTTASLELRGGSRTRVRLLRVEIEEIRRAVVAESPIDLSGRQSRLVGLASDGLLLPEGSTNRLEIEELSEVPKDRATSPTPTRGAPRPGDDR